MLFFDNSFVYFFVVVVVTISNTVTNIFVDP